MTELVEHIPKNYPILVDFIPWLNYQIILNKKPDDLFCGAIKVRQQIAPSKAETKKIGDLTMQEYDRHTKESLYNFGYENPKEAKYTQKDIYLQAQDISGVDNIKIESWGQIIPKPKILDSNPKFEGVNELYHLQYARGNYYNMIGDRFNIMLPNYAKSIKNQLYDTLKQKHVIKKSTDIAHLLSTLRTKYILDDQHIGRQGWQPLSPDTQKDLLLTIYRTIRKDKWYEDTAIPVKFEMPLDGIGNATAYTLEERGHCLVI